MASLPDPNHLKAVARAESEWIHKVKAGAQAKEPHHPSMQPTFGQFHHLLEKTAKQDLKELGINCTVCFLAGFSVKDLHESRILESHVTAMPVYQSLFKTVRFLVVDSCPFAD